MPEPISFVEKDILVNGVSTQMVAGTLKASGLPEQRIGEILGWWIVGATGNSRPAPFDFATDVEPEDPSADITYTRQFTHTDWVDGEDRVQASSTPEELGFNARFHAIENEFDAIRAQFLTLAGGVRELRADLFGVVHELESKITALQDDLYDLRTQIGSQTSAPTGPRSPSGLGNLGVLGTVKLGDKSAYITQTGDSFQLIEFAGSTLGQTETLPSGLLSPGVIFDPAHARPQDVVDIVSGLDDLVASPSIKEVVDRPGATVADLRSAVGGAILPSGVTAASVLAALPADQPLSGDAGTVSMLTQQLVAQLPQATADAVLGQVVSDSSALAGPAASLGTASAEVVGLNPGIVGALTAAGVDTTVGGLAKLSTSNLSQALSGTGVSVSNDALRDAIARSRIVGAIAAHH